jgi:hypothetical protein
MNRNMNEEIRGEEAEESLQLYMLEGPFGQGLKSGLIMEGYI